MIHHVFRFIYCCSWFNIWILRKLRFFSFSMCIVASDRSHRKWATQSNPAITWCIIHTFLYILGSSWSPCMGGVFIAANDYGFGVFSSDNYRSNTHACGPDWRASHPVPQGKCNLQAYTISLTSLIFAVENIQDSCSSQFVHQRGMWQME